tara:strand:- start:1283 stop:1552 length:270 start_codon:yes stop_codon:yes gene_type:complete
MIHTTRLEYLEQFQELKKGDMVACEWKLDSYKDNKRTRFATYTIVENKERTTEIILQTKNNIYFNYSMFLFPEKDGGSNLKSITLIECE